MGKYLSSDQRSGTSQQGSKAWGFGPPTLLPRIATEVAQAWAALAALCLPLQNFGRQSESLRRKFLWIWFWFPDRTLSFIDLLIIFFFTIAKAAMKKVAKRAAPKKAPAKKAPKKAAKKAVAKKAAKGKGKKKWSTPVELNRQSLATVILWLP